MTTLFSRKPDADRTKGALEDAISRLTETSDGPDLRARLGDAGSRLGDVGNRIGDAGNRIVESGNRIVESGAETARAVAREARGLPTLAQGAAARVREAASAVPVRVQLGKPPRRPMLPFVVLGIATAAVGALLAFLFDPQMGRSRRAMAGDRVAAGARRANRWSARQRGRVAAKATAVREQIRYTGASAEPLDEVALANKVKSELFRDPTIDKGSININAERDVVFLRGTAPTDAQIGGIVALVESIDGVRKVVSLLHVPGAPVPVMAEEATAGETESDRPSWALPH